MNLREMVFSARSKLKDLNMRRWKDHELVHAANEAKNELVKIIRQGKRDFFEATTSVTIEIAAAPNASSFTLPADFLSLKDMTVTTANYDWIRFIHVDRTDPRFKLALQIGGAFLNGDGFFYWDLVGNTRVVLAPGSDIQLLAELDYMQLVANMHFPDDEPSVIPEEHHDFIVSYIVSECMRETNDPQLDSYLKKVQDQREMIFESVADMQVREHQLVRGFMEGEW